jgi:hypothetical protein
MHIHSPSHCWSPLSVSYDSIFSIGERIHSIGSNRLDEVKLNNLSDSHCYEETAITLVSSILIGLVCLTPISFIYTEWVFFPHG